MRYAAIILANVTACKIVEEAFRGKASTYMGDHRAGAGDRS